MEPIEFIVPAVPVAQPRQRHRVVEPKHDRRFVHNYTPTGHPVNAYKATIRQVFSEVYSGPPLTGALRLIAIFVLPRPSSMRWKRRAMLRVRHCKKRPDLDNLVKSLQDALNGLAWHDDGQVASHDTSKWIAAGDEQPHVAVKIESLDGETE